MDPLTLDSIIITEDKDGSGGFDLSLVDPPEEFRSEEDKPVIEPEINLFQREPDPDQSSQELSGETDVLSSLNDDSNKNVDNPEIGNEDIRISLDDDVKNGISVDLFGFDSNSSSNMEENYKPVNLSDSNETEKEIIISEDKVPAVSEHVKKTIHPDESLQLSLKENLEESSNMNINHDVNDKELHLSLQTTPINDDSGDDIDISVPDMGMQRMTHDSSSDDEFDFELPPVKRKSIDNGTALVTQPSQEVDTKPQNTVAEQKTVVIETPPATTSLMTSSTDVSTVNNITSTTRKIIEYKEESSPTNFEETNSQKKAFDDWENVQTIEAGFMKDGEEVKAKLPESTPLLSYYEMQETIIKTDFQSVKPNIHVAIDRHGFSALKHFLFGPPKMHRTLLPNREKVFCIAASTFSNGNSTHIRALQTIYRCLTGSRFDCKRFGSHWEEIGFQGSDPSTDLRGAGLLGLLHLIYLLRDPKCQAMAKDIYKLSLHPTQVKKYARQIDYQNFPFCVMGINMSRITLQSLREDCLNKECNKRKDVLSVVNEFYAGLYLQMYQIWKSQGKTITDSGFVIKHLESEAKKNPHHILKNFEDYFKNKKSSVNLDNMDPGGDNFLSVCETEAGQY